MTTRWTGTTAPAPVLFELEGRFFELRDDLPAELDLCFGRASGWQSTPYMGCWHKPSCRTTKHKYEGAWSTGIPLAVALQMWPTASATAPIGYCQLCMMREVK